VRLGKYLKVAFLNQWNLLAFLGASAFAFLSGAPDIVLPVVAAGEIAYLGLLGTHPKFQAYVEAQEAKKTREAQSETSQQALERITTSLPKELLDRFLNLRARCRELQQIASELKQTNHEDAHAPLESFQVAGLDRLLWIHLRLLFTHYTLQRFLKQTSGDQIQADIKRLEAQLAELPSTGTSDQLDRIRKTLEDNLQTSRDRLENVRRARDNFDLVKLEIERLENKIKSLSELAVNRQEPEYISGQVDQVATSMIETEKTMNELRFVTGFDGVDEAPSLMEGELKSRPRVRQVQ
jgi:hypothetical protein